jgi:hypothetical protein
MVIEGPGGVLVVTVWRDGDQLRARLRFTDPTTGAEAVTAVVGSDAVIERVRAWLDEVRASSPRRQPPPGPRR